MSFKVQVSSPPCANSSVHTSGCSEHTAALPSFDNMSWLFNRGTETTEGRTMPTSVVLNWYLQPLIIKGHKVFCRQTQSHFLCKIRRQCFDIIFPTYSFFVASNSGDWITATNLSLGFGFFLCREKLLPSLVRVMFLLTAYKADKSSPTV